MNSLFLFALLQLLPGLSVEAKNQRISEDVLRKLSQVKTMEDFIRIFKVKKRPGVGSIGVGSIGVETGVVTQGYIEPPVCKPRPVPVVLGGGSTSRYIYAPACIMANRCSGCELRCPLVDCKHCGPTASETNVIDVIRLNPNTSASEYVKMSFESHTACDCVCIQKPTVCANKKQTWNEDRCECACPEKKLCPSHKQFSVLSCDCICIEDCEDGVIQDKDTCTCPSQDSSSYDESNGDIDSFQWDNSLTDGNHEYDDELADWFEDDIDN